ncbi:MAG: Fic family protein [bacterium]
MSINEGIALKLRKIDEFKEEISIYKSKDKNLSSKLKDFYRVSSVYSTNAIEGNTLTESETKVVIEDGITIGGKTVREHLEAVNSAKAYDFIYTLLNLGRITEDNILQIYKLVLSGIDDENAGKYRREAVFISGTEYAPPPYKKVPELINIFIKKLNKQGNEHSIIKAADMHAEFESIHPFTDGNGRTGRFILSFELIKNGYPPFIVYPIKRLDYINSLRVYNIKNDIAEIRNFVVENIYETIKDLKRFLDNAIGKSESIINTPEEDAFTKDLNNRLNKSKGWKR